MGPRLGGGEGVLGGRLAGDFVGITTNIFVIVGQVVKLLIHIKFLSGFDLSHNLFWTARSNKKFVLGIAKTIKNYV